MSMIMREPETLTAILPGITHMAPLEQMQPEARKLRDTYARKPGAPFVQREFWFMQDTVNRWTADEGAIQWEAMGLDTCATHILRGLGWCEAAFAPQFEVRVLEDRGEHELVQDEVGRHVLYFKGRREGFMPEYVDHPVKDWKSWTENVKWRMDAARPERLQNVEQTMGDAQSAAANGLLIQQQLIGGYMYLRSLIGPVQLLYMVYDNPELIHDCMRTWLALADSVIARHQRFVTLDEVFLAEDICYNHGSLISHAMMQEFLLPYYQQLIANIRPRQLDRTRHLYIQIDTDGLADPVIPFYRELGMDVMSPFEVASGSDVVRTGHEYPDLVISGGIDKRLLCQPIPELDRALDRILPAMHARGGYIPTLDHGIPCETPYAHYLHYRRRCLEFNS